MISRVCVAALGALANTVLPADYKDSPENRSVLQRYLRIFPLRMDKAGIEVDAHLKDVVKATHFQSQRESGVCFWFSVFTADSIHAAYSFVFYVRGWSQHISTIDG